MDLMGFGSLGSVGSGALSNSSREIVKLPEDAVDPENRFANEPET